jgi:3-oxoacyl-[acyl-carrier-protein] synthase II
VGLVLGTAFGSLDPSAAFMHRLFEKGPRLASPAEFPNLVPSSPVGHVSIYHGLEGVSVATADLGTSGESAVAQAIELIAGGDADAIVAGGVEEASDLVERIRACVAAWGGGTIEQGRSRSEGAATLVLEAESHARRRGASPLAVVTSILSWTDAPPDRLPAPSDGRRARVVTVRDTPATTGLLAASAWADAPRARLSPAAGDHEGIGATALVAAVRLLSREAVSQVLVLGTSRGRGYAIVLAGSVTERG